MVYLFKNKTYQAEILNFTKSCFLKPYKNQHNFMGWLIWFPGLVWNDPNMNK